MAVYCEDGCNSTLLKICEEIPNQLPKGEQGRAQPTDPARYVDLVPPRGTWDLQAFTD